jgi:voltage-gated potassium channel
MLTLILSALGLTVVTVIIHGAGTVAAMGRAVRRQAGLTNAPGCLAVELVMSELIGTLLLLHLAEAIVWALFLVWIGGLPDVETAMYFSLTSYTTVGYGDVLLSPRWRLLGPIEAAVGVLMLGWSTGILIAVIGATYRELFPAPKTR